VTRDTELRKGLLLTLQASGDQYFVKFHYSWQMEFNISGRLILFGVRKIFYKLSTQMATYSDETTSCYWSNKKIHYSLWSMVLLYCRWVFR